MTPSQSIPCRICNLEAKYWFPKKIFSGHTIHYYTCQSCGHVQTEQPYWLDEIYQNLNFNIDTGMVSRSIDNAELSVSLAQKLKFDGTHTCIDFGAGTGLTVRYCRDLGLNMLYLDPYSKNTFANGFEASPPNQTTDKVHLITAFEVAEHFPDPVNNFKEIFDYQPQTVFFSTWLCENQETDWWYFTPDGQHVSLYTKESLTHIAKLYGYRFLTYKNLHLFTQLDLSPKLLRSIGKRVHQKAHAFKKKHESKTVADHYLAIENAAENTHSLSAN